MKSAKLQTRGGSLPEKWGRNRGDLDVVLAAWRRVETDRRCVWVFHNVKHKLEQPPKNHMESGSPSASGTTTTNQGWKHNNAFNTSKHTTQMGASLSEQPPAYRSTTERPRATCKPTRSGVEMRELQRWATWKNYWKSDRLTEGTEWATEIKTWKFETKLLKFEYEIMESFHDTWKIVQSCTWCDIFHKIEDRTHFLPHLSLY
jgi:hypothetical protein